MGLYKMCRHRGRSRDRCEHPWWGSATHKGHRVRVNLMTWAGEPVHTKERATLVYGRLRDVVKTDRYAKGAGGGPSGSFAEFCDLYLERYVHLKGLRSYEGITRKLVLFKARWPERKLSEIRVGDIDDLVADLKAKGRKQATVNRYLALLRHMFNWAIDRDYLVQSPMRKVKLEPEYNERQRRISDAEEVALLAAANPLCGMLIIAALDTGMRRGELLSLTWADVDFDRGLLTVRAERAKSKKARGVPIATMRLRQLLTYLSIGPDGRRHPDAARVFTRLGYLVTSFRTAWERARAAAGIPDVRFHDLRHEYASRLVERGIPLAQVRDLLGHSTIAVTERYDHQTVDRLITAAKRLETGEAFQPVKNQSDPVDSETRPNTPTYVS